MYSILIVDDEPIIRRGIKTFIDFEKYKINDIYEAEDGNSAFKTFSDVLPDLVLLDINIPFKDNIEKLQNENSILKKEISELITEFKEAKVILENRNDALLNNGFYSLYFKYIFARKKYIKEGEKVLEDIKKEIDIKKEKIKENNIEIRESPEVLNKVLEKLSEISSFPI